MMDMETMSFVYMMYKNFESMNVHGYVYYVL